MRHYLTRWEIDVYADSPEDAARCALEIQRDPTSTATVFEVLDVETSGPGVRVDVPIAASQPEGREAALIEAARRSLNWLASYPGGCASGAYNEMRAALAPFDQPEHRERP
jgi:hypothetical protein